MQENKEKQTMGLVTVTSGYVLWGLLALVSRRTGGAR